MHTIGVHRRLATLNGVDVFHARDDTAIDGVLAVQEVVVGEVDEELAVGRVRVLAARRAERATVVWDLGEFGWKVRLVGAAGTCATQVKAVDEIAVLDVACLSHETIDHAVEDDIVIFTRTRELFHAITMCRRDVGQKLNGDCAIFQLDQDRVFGVFVVGPLALL